MFGEDPREGGDSEDRPNSPAKPLRIAMLDQDIVGGKLDPARRGDAGEQNPYFVLVTRKREELLPASVIPSKLLVSRCVFGSQTS